MIELNNIRYTTYNKNKINKYLRVEKFQSIIKEAFKNEKLEFKLKQKFDVLQFLFLLNLKNIVFKYFISHRSL